MILFMMLFFINKYHYNLLMILFPSIFLFVLKTFQGVDKRHYLILPRIVTQARIPIIVT
jgi:hypothetical protein